MKKSLWIFTLATMLSAETTMLKDPATHLIWEDTEHVEIVKVNHLQAKTYCKNLTLGGYNDWRLPTLPELMSIIDYARYKPAILKEFRYVDEDTLYWSSTPFARSADEYWGVSFKDGGTDNTGEIYDRYVRCVRKAK